MRHPSPQRRRTVALLALALLGPAVGVRAAPSTITFSCRDDEGRMITSDRPIADCADRPMAVHGADGRVKREIEPPPTEEEAQQQAEDASRRRANRRELEAQSQRDRGLIEQYRTIERLERARTRELGVLEQRAALLRARIQVTEQHLRDNEQGGRIPPGDPRLRRLAVARDELAEDRAALAALERESVTARRRFDADAQRLRELRELRAER